MFNNVRASIESLVEYFSGWRTSRRLLVFESDDWGGLYLPNILNIKNLEEAGILRPDRTGYERYDCLETKEDLEVLFNVLSSFKDIYGNPVKFTFNTVMGNPDFRRMEEAEFRSFFHQHFFESYKLYNDEDCSQIWRLGIADKLFMPQFHAREHVNVRLWMDDLRNGRRETRIAFNNAFYALNRSKSPPRSYMAAYWPFSDSHLQEILEITSDGLRMFNSTFGFPSTSFVACSYVLPSEVERITFDNGVQLIQTQRRHRTPTVRNVNAKVTRISGSKNHFGQYYSVRNIFFEPFELPLENWAYKAFEQTKSAFRRGRPGIVSTHRVNYVGGRDIRARDARLKQLVAYLRMVTEMYSDIEFLSTDQLLNIMLKKE